VGKHGRAKQAENQRDEPSRITPNSPRNIEHEQSESQGDQVRHGSALKEHGLQWIAELVKKVISK